MVYITIFYHYRIDFDNLIKISRWIEDNFFNEGITLSVDHYEAAIVLDLKLGSYSAILTSTEATEKEAYEIVE